MLIVLSLTCKLFNFCLQIFKGHFVINVFNVKVKSLQEEKPLAFNYVFFMLAFSLFYLFFFWGGGESRRSNTTVSAMWLNCTKFVKLQTSYYTYTSTVLPWNLFLTTYKGHPKYSVGLRARQFFPEKRALTFLEGNCILLNYILRGTLGMETIAFIGPWKFMYQACIHTSFHVWENYSFIFLAESMSVTCWNDNLQYTVP